MNKKIKEVEAKIEKYKFLLANCSQEKQWLYKSLLDYFKQHLKELTIKK